MRAEFISFVLNSINVGADTAAAAAAARAARPTRQAAAAANAALPDSANAGERIILSPMRYDAIARARRQNGGDAAAAQGSPDAGNSAAAAAHGEAAGGADGDAVLPGADGEGADGEQDGGADGGALGSGADGGADGRAHGREHGGHARTELWSIEQGYKLINYFDSCWHLPDMIRAAWLDARVLTLDADLVASTGPPESSHRWWDEHHMKLLHNRDVLTVAMKTVGVTMNGAAMFNFFGASQTRFRTAKETLESIDVRVAQSKADYAFLKHSDSIILADAETAFVKKADDGCIRRHAEPGLHDYEPFPSALWPMRRKLAHAGPRSYEQQSSGYYTVDRVTGRCDCDASHRWGVRSSRGSCKHRRRELLETESSAGPEQRAAVRAVAFRRLLHHVHERERSRPPSSRCMALYEATTEVELLAALASHPSIPPTGKSTGIDDLPAEQAAEETIEADADDDGYEAATLSCTFQATADLGIVFAIAPERDEQVYDELVVRAYCQLRNGEFGPAPHRGDQLRPGDVVTAIDGVSELVPLLSPTGVLELPPALAEAAITMAFRRGTCRAPPCLECDEDEADTAGAKGGRPAKRVAKFPAQQTGGARPRKGRKPERGNPMRYETLELPPARGSVAKRVEALREQLLGNGAAERLARHASRIEEENVEATYVP